MIPNKLTRDTGDDPLTVRSMPDDTKVEINELLFYSLPDTTTLRQMEGIAVRIFDLIQHAWSDREASV